MSLRKAVSESFQPLDVPPPIDQLAPEALIAAIGSAAEGATFLRVVDVRQPDEFAAGHVVGAVNCPSESFDPQGLMAEVKEAHTAGKAPMLVFTSLQSPDLDMNTAMAFVQACEEHGLDAATGTVVTSYTFTLLGGVHNWLEEFKGDAARVAVSA